MIHSPSEFIYQKTECKVIYKPETQVPCRRISIKYNSLLEFNIIPNWISAIDRNLANADIKLFLMIFKNGK